MSAIKEYDSEEERLFSVIVAAWHREKYRKRQLLGRASYPKHSLADIGYLMFGISEARVHVVNERVVAAMARSERRQDRRAAVKAMRRLACVILLFILPACETSYKVAPSTTKLTTKVATAHRSVQHSQEVTKQIEATSQVIVTNATTTEAHVSAALDAIGKHDYVTAAQELILGKASNALVMEMLRQSIRDVQSLKQSLEEAGNDLTAAEGEIEILNKKVDKVVEQGAKDRAIVDQVNWGFGLGAFIYGIKRILTFGFFGALILIVAVVVILCIGGPVAVFVMNGLRAGWSWVKTKKG